LPARRRLGLSRGGQTKRSPVFLLLAAGLALAAADAGAAEPRFKLDPAPYAASQTTLAFDLSIIRLWQGCWSPTEEGLLCPLRSYHHEGGVARNIEDVEAFPALEP